MEEFIDEEMILSVKRGAYWMDEHHPGWARLIELNSLNMGNCDYCIIGQAVIGGYWKGLAEGSGCENPHVETASVWAIDHGFDSPIRANATWNNDPMAESYHQLEILWTEEVRNRLG